MCGTKKKEKLKCERECVRMCEMRASVRAYAYGKYGLKVFTYCNYLKVTYCKH